MLKPRKSPFDRHKRPRNKLFMENIAGAERKPFTPDEYKKWLESRLPQEPQPRKKSLTLSEKANELARLAAQSKDPLKHDPDSFVNFFQYRRVLKGQMKKYYSDPVERRRAFISAVGGKGEIERSCNGINRWAKKWEDLTWNLRLTK